MSCRLCDGRYIPEAVRAIINGMLDDAESQNRNIEIREPPRPPTSMPSDLDCPPESEDLFAGTQGSSDLDCPPESEDLFAGTQWPTDAPVPGPCNLSPLRKGWRRKANKLSFSVLNDRETEAYKPKAPNKLVSEKKQREAEERRPPMITNDHNNTRHEEKIKGHNTPEGFWKVGWEPTPEQMKTQTYREEQ